MCASALVCTWRCAAGGARVCPFDQVDLVPLIVSLLHNDARLKWQIKAFKNCTTMNIFSEPLDASFVGLSEDAYLEAICTRYRLQICSVPSNGGCYFDSIYALLPTVGKAVKSARDLRLSCVEFFKQCYQGQHGLVGERVQEDIRGCLEHKIVSSCLTRFTNKAPKTVDNYLEAVSKHSVWVEGATSYCGHNLFLTLPAPCRFPLAQSCLRHV